MAPLPLAGPLDSPDLVTCPPWMDTHAEQPVARFANQAKSDWWSAAQRQPLRAVEPSGLVGRCGTTNCFIAIPRHKTGLRRVHGWSGGIRARLRRGGTMKKDAEPNAGVRFGILLRTLQSSVGTSLLNALCSVSAPMLGRLAVRHFWLFVPFVQCQVEFPFPSCLP